MNVRHAVIPDTQIRPGVDTTHLDWAAQAIVEYKPDTIVIMGDWWDMPSLSTHDAPGSKEAEGRRVKADIDAGNEAFDRFTAPILKEMKRLVKARRKHWNPGRVFLFGNHEDRISRAIYNDPKWDGILGLHSLETPGFERIAYQRIVNIHGVRYCHFYPNPFSGRPIGGTIVNRLGHIGHTFTQGHQQGYMYACKQYPDHIKHGLVCGRFYSHQEGYRPGDVQDVEWNGIVVKNDVREVNGQGDYDLMPLRYRYLRQKYARPLDKKRLSHV